jgi:hypothetical protein
MSADLPIQDNLTSDEKPYVLRLVLTLLQISWHIPKPVFDPTIALEALLPQVNLAKDDQKILEPYNPKQSSGICYGSPFD